MKLPSVRPLGRLAHPSCEEFLRRYAARRRPVVIENGAGSPETLARWDPNRLALRSGARTVHAHFTTRGFDPQAFFADPEGYTARFPMERMETRAMRLRDCLARMSDGSVHSRAGTYSLAAVSLSEVAPSLSEVALLPEYCRRLGCTRVTFWAGPRGKKWTLHRDDGDVFIGHLHGSKSLLLVAPGETRCVYPHPNNPLLSRIPDAQHPELRRFPAFRRAHPLGCRLQPGDLLYIPRNWWHQVHYEELSISLSFWPPLE